MKRLSLVCLVLTLAGLSAVPALAHAELVGAEPAPGEVVDRPPKQIVLRFDSVISPQSKMQLVGSNIEVASTWSQSVQGSTLTAVSNEPLPPGTYTVVWTAVSLDSHVATGSYQFGVAAPKPAVPVWLALSLSAVGILAVMAAAAVVRRRRAES